MTIDTVVVHIAGAVYSCGDVMIFKVLQQIGGSNYLNVTVQCEQVCEDSYTFRWDNVPEEVMEVYEFVNKKSYLNGSILFGPHIGRIDENNYAICKFSKPVIGEAEEVTEFCEQMPVYWLRFAKQIRTRC
jgi:hypothetical protein